MDTQQKLWTTTLWGLLVIAMLALVGTGIWRTRGSNNAEAQAGAVIYEDSKLKPGELPTLFDAPAFKLVDQNARDFTDRDLRGRAWIASFVFTHCAGPCPMMFQKMAGLQKTISDPHVHLVSFTVDPQRDTPEVLKAKAGELGADNFRWHFLTGEAKSVDAVARGMLQPRPGPQDSPLLHSTRFLLFDGQGRCRGIYDSTLDEEMSKLAEDAQKLAADAAGKAP
jgi:cytochrome oxidase Cu insertion factor (SCO1/SenC/PrrC family)